ncbi:hypothetical protein SNE40_010021 [Patella caerulea]|uniref:Uncharacterized protein n=1 Tax=Patella caerulea TaxID=87958 RepID=A0AAN8PSE8_PATCE
MKSKDNVTSSPTVMSNLTELIPDPLRKEFCPNPKTITRSTPENEITVVTAYFNIGSFRKGHDTKFDTKLYKSWMKTFQYLHNPLIVYVDDQEVAEIFEKLRKDLKSMTKIIMLDRTKLWSFGLNRRITNIFSNASYPKFHPNTVVPEYSCAQHAKYECVQRAIQVDYFSSHHVHYSWLDIGYFREIVSCAYNFKLVLPDNFNKNRISFTQVNNAVPAISISDIFLKNQVWVGGGMILASKDVFENFIHHYMEAVEIFLEKSLMNSDQQVIYAIYSEVGRQFFNPNVELQLYGSYNGWFYLGFLCHRSFNTPTLSPSV